MTDWQSVLAEPVAAAEHGIEAEAEWFGSLHDGPLTFDRIDYPAAQVYLEEFSRADATNWEVAVSTTLYFEWDRETDTREDILHPLAAVMDATLAAFADVGCITDYHPARIDFFSGEPTNTLVLAVSVRWHVTQLLNPGDFDSG